MSHDRPGGRRLPVLPLLVVLLVLTVVSAVVSLALGSEPLKVSGVVELVPESDIEPEMDLQP